ncbi:plasmid pRiA4b ORF-3 family protein [Agathobaculum sp. NTUH-O15-33]|uniref:plasmid pRiA4b ORF-3 family protein n=1 Tax=Agathobaculum sp. NTUH-O15-33 TaxID=3079302 RepID=UPI002958A3C1|nr:plasmid pRiA4b ORF-3 family protein [Agathobaculum sp. NTUH-O15-33]WNX86053.1 plasmid pRiA4b ORF-3 family protein [Agathobaculum sp. NTUH-O15-33]
MADVYKFKVRLCELENVMWRDIEITSVSSVAKLGYAVLAAFESTASHLFNIRFDGKRYEIVFEEDDFDDEPAINPIRTKLSALKLSVGDKLSMEYDYGAGWEFEIELLSISEMKRGAGTHYPYVTDGKGNGIIEDTSPYELAEMVEKTDKDGTLPQIMDMYSGKEVSWDYRKFELEYCNVFFKDNVWKIQNAYEEFE